MPIRKDSRNKSWYYRFYRGRSYFKGGFGTKKEAEDAEATALNQANAGGAYTKRPSKDLTFGEAGKLFFDNHASKKRSWVTYRAMINVLTEPLGKFPLKRISPEMLETTLDQIQQARNHVDLTRNHYLAMVRAIYNRMKKWRLYFGENPAQYLEMKKVPRARVRFLYPAEEKILTPALAAEPAIWPYYFTALHTGMRLSEICRMKVEDIDYVTCNIFVPDSKNGRSRHVPMSKDLAAFLQSYTAGKAPNAPAMFNWCRYWVGKRFVTLCKQAKIEKFTFHCLRHSFCARMLAKGVPIYKVAKILGHSSVQVTEQHYGHLSLADLQGAIKEIQGVVSGPFAAICSGPQKSQEDRQELALETY